MKTVIADDAPVVVPAKKFDWFETFRPSISINAMPEGSSSGGDGSGGDGGDGDGSGDGSGDGDGGGDGGGGDGA